MFANRLAVCYKNALAQSAQFSWWKTKTKKHTFSLWCARLRRFSNASISREHLSLRETDIALLLTEVSSVSVHKLKWTSCQLDSRWYGMQTGSQNHCPAGWVGTAGKHHHQHPAISGRGLDLQALLLHVLLDAQLWHKHTLNSNAELLFENYI